MGSVYNCTPAIGLEEIYDLVDVGSIIEYKSKYSKKWALGIVLNKEINTVYSTKVHNIRISSKVKSYTYYDLRDESDFGWRYEDLYDCNKHLLAGYKSRTKYVRMVNPDNIKNMLEFVETPDKETAILISFFRNGFVDKKSIDDKSVNFTYHTLNDRKRGKGFIKLWRNGKLISEFWCKEPLKCYLDETITQKWMIQMSRKS